MQWVALLGGETAAQSAVEMDNCWADSSAVTSVRSLAVTLAVR